MRIAPSKTSLSFFGRLQFLVLLNRFSNSDQSLQYPFRSSLSPKTPHFFFIQFGLVSMRIRSSFISSDPSICNSSAFKCSTDSRSLVIFQTNSSTSIDFNSRCEGLDLLVEAAIYISGELFLESPNMDHDRIGSKESKDEDQEQEEEEVVEKGRVIDVISKPKRRQRVMALPSKYNDSILQPWKRRTRARRSVLVKCTVVVGAAQQRWFRVIRDVLECVDDVFGTRVDVILEACVLHLSSCASVVTLSGKSQRPLSVQGQLTLVNWSRVNCRGPFTGPWMVQGPFVPPLVSNQGHYPLQTLGSFCPAPLQAREGRSLCSSPASPLGTTPKGPQRPGAGELRRLSGQGRQVLASHGWAGARVLGEGGVPLSLSSRLAVAPLFLSGSNGDGGTVAALAGDAGPCHPFRFGDQRDDGIDSGNHARKIEKKRRKKGFDLF
ncbi:hypothetical protein Sjap_006390 [Stephania japonica]|uniref:Uncharacterized protein n=1 Tax=Stephania japonica TaxID=461633 RepID=A0AAP0K5T5_9MAGN